MLDEASLVQDHCRIHGHHRVGLKAPNDAHQLLAQGEVVLERAIRTVEEVERTTYPEVPEPERFFGRRDDEAIRP
jgi:hypothetical protein